MQVLSERFTKGNTIELMNAQLLYAARVGNMARLIALVEENNVEVNARDKVESTTTIIAASHA